MSEWRRTNVVCDFKRDGPPPSLTFHVNRLYAIVITKSPITAEEFGTRTQPLIGLTVSRPWRGYGSALFLELGKLHRAYRRTGQPKGEAGVMIEWSWRVESPAGIQFGSWSGKRKMEHGILGLIGHKIEGIALTGRLPEISIRLSGGKWVHSFMTAEGQPEWGLFLPDSSWLCVRRGRLFQEYDNQAHADAGQPQHATDESQPFNYRANNVFNRLKT